MSPFNSTDWRSGYNAASTWFSNAGNFGRSKMVNVKDQFYAGTAGAGANYNGNPSQHAVLGQRYSTTWTSWRATAWSSYILKKRGSNVNVLRETALLTCADCHVLDAGAGAHGGARKYNLWASVISENGTGSDGMCNRCHANVAYTASGGTANGSRYAHSYTRSTSVSYGLPNAYQNACLTCHAAWDGLTTITRQNSYGGVHGSWTSISNVGATAAGYRFFPGTWRKQAMTTTAYSGTTGISCYFPGTAGESFANCTSHNGATTAIGTPNYGRPVNY
jgi:hypothetical protein